MKYSTTAIDAKPVWRYNGAHGDNVIGKMCEASTKETTDTIFGVIKAVIGIRVSEEEELKGLDIGEHGMEAYPGFQNFITD